MRPHRSRTALVFLAAFMALGEVQGARAEYPVNHDREPVYEHYDALRDEIVGLTQITDEALRTTALDAIWERLVGGHQVPFVDGDRVAFLYRGSAATVAWAGDFSGWQPVSGTQVPGTDLWVLEQTFHADSRLDYKVVRNGSWILDPNNPLFMYSGFGPNSELRMPEYVFPVETVRRAGVARGGLTANARIATSRLAHDVNVRVYTPAGYDEERLKDLPVVYVTDGHEYLDDRLGAMVTVMDNLIADGALRPMIAVFVDPRDPDQPSLNRRSDLYVNNSAFVAFLAEDLVPLIDEHFRTDASAGARTIMGTSLGGLHAAYTTALRPDVFGNAGVQSPAFWAYDGIYDWYRTLDLQDEIRISMTSGAEYDGNGGSTMDAILSERGFEYRYIEVNEGHSWGQWRGLLDELLIDLVGPPVGVPEPASGALLAGGLAALSVRSGSAVRKDRRGDEVE